MLIVKGLPDNIGFNNKVHIRSGTLGESVLSKCFLSDDRWNCSCTPKRLLVYHAHGKC